MTGRTVLINGTVTRYWIFNPKKKETLVLIHGYRGNHRGLSWLAAKLNNYRLIMPDLPGYGESESLKISHTMAHYAGWLKKFIKKIHPHPYVLVGHSYGASVCAVFAARTPVNLKKLILISPVAESNTLVALLGRAYYSLAARLPAGLRHDFLAEPFFDRLTGELLLKVAKGKLKKDITVYRAGNLKELVDRAVIEGYADLRRIDLFEFAKKITTPTLIVAGAKDQVAPLITEQRFQKSINNSQLVILEDVGHLSPLELSSAVSHKMKKFLNS